MEKAKNKIPYGRQWLDNDDIKEIVKVLKSDWLTQGPKVEEFEKKFANYCGAKYAVAVSSGSAALHLAFLASGVKEGDEFITTPLTFAATSNMGIFCGATPVFADIKEDTLNIDPSEIEKKITDRTKAIVCVDFAGCPCEYDRILEIAKKNNLLVIEDAAHSLGSEYKGKKVGSIADITAFSFHPVKTITTGEGGMVLTDNKDFYDKIKNLRHHGIVKNPEKGMWYYEIKEPGFNYRLTDIQSALGISQLKKLGKFIKLRKKIVDKYNESFKNLEGILTPSCNDCAKAVFHIYPIRLQLNKLKSSREEILKSFLENGLGVQVHYMPLHMHSFYQKKFGYKKGDFPVSERYYESAVSVPLFPKMTSQEINKVISTVKKIIHENIID